MKFPGDSTWVITSGDGGTFALFVRDALGISTPAADSVPLESVIRELAQ